jgi:2-polyprenyl-3-methyl-5-hydroxy-6-metoxy-1,4-benzoquinol methylase
MSVRRIRPCARSRGAAIAVAPTLRPVADDLAKRAARLRANGVLVPALLATDAAAWLLTAGALLAGWTWGLAALAAYCLQPYLIFTGTPLRPRDLHASALLRPLHDPWTWARTAAGRWRSAAEHARDEEKAASVLHYREALAGGTVRFAADRATRCPWCGSDVLSVAVRSRDLSYGKPGRFTLERCGGCGHVFQNPRLRPEALAFYYRDVYDGLGTDSAEVIFLHQRDSYLGRIRMVAPLLEPKAWLDVGAGHAHFCALAGEAWPDTAFDAIDQGAGITEAERRGWITTGYRGEFRDLASQLAGRYDVISMHHYLEHTADPRAELDAAVRVLPPGGHLLIELPDPQWPLARVLGQYWMSWFQPQHLNMMTVANLTAALEERGLRPAAVERGRAHQGFDLVAAVVLLLARIAPDRSMPWSPRPATTLSRAWRSFAWVAGSPFLAAGLVLDSTLVRAFARRCDRGNAYRVLAVKDGI